jgi:hypothetical protein
MPHLPGHWILRHVVADVVVVEETPHHRRNDEKADDERNSLASATPSKNGESYPAMDIPNVTVTFITN